MALQTMYVCVLLSHFSLIRMLLSLGGYDTFEKSLIEATEGYYTRESLEKIEEYEVRGRNG